MSGITINEFTVAMETYGANRLENRSGSRYPVSVPCFEVCGVAFMHSGSYYIVQRDRKVPDDIMNQAMAKFGAEHPGDRKNYWWGEVHSIKGMIVLASLLEGKYATELVDELTNNAYKRLLAETAENIKTVEEIQFKKINTRKMKELRNVLSAYSQVVNPFCNSQLRFKDPIEYLDKVALKVSGKNISKNAVYVSLSSNTSSVDYRKDIEGWSYQSGIILQRNRRNKYLKIGHYYNNGLDKHSVDEVIYVDYSDRADRGYYDHPDDLDLRISLKTGLAWKTYHEDQAHLATDKELDIVISHLKDSIKRIKHRIVNKMVQNWSIHFIFNDFNGVSKFEAPFFHKKIGLL